MPLLWESSPASLASRLDREATLVIIPARLPWTLHRRNRAARFFEQFVADKPGDAFARYGLALECVKLGDDPAATGHFHKLLEIHPEYVAGYFQFGQHLARLGQIDEARKLLSDGMVVAQKTGDTHARDEMETALAMLR